MPYKESSDPRKNFVPRFLPWLLAAAALVVYWFTLNRWVSMYNLQNVAKISGWIWQKEVFNPVFFVVTYPFRWLPAPQIPLTLNVFSAVCAALTLGFLARSVALLPHDRTDAQRRREHSEFSFLTIRSAWLPPILAVGVCGLQFTFWQNATNCMGEMFDLLLFAFVIWLLLEFRLDEREWRLFLAATVYGAGMAENWAMVGFLPLFIGAIVWIRGLDFFNLRFIQRMVLYGLLGMLFYLLLPLLAAISTNISVPFWQALKFNLAGQYAVVKAFFVMSDVRKTLGLLSLTSLLPMFLLSIRWTSSFGDRSRMGATLAGLIFHFAHGVILFTCIWVAFDSPLSPRYISQQYLGGLPCLTLYYITALVIGYYSGYFLLVFGREPGSRSSVTGLLPAQSKLRQLQSQLVQLLNPLIFNGTWILSVFAVTGLFFKNAPQIRANNDDTLLRYTSLVKENLPRNGGVLLCDDPQRLFLVRAALTREGRAKDFLMLDTQSLNWPAYYRFLHEKSPRKWSTIIENAEMTNNVSPIHILGFLDTLAKTNDLYYLHPSFGYYFERFYPEPHGLIYKLKTLPVDALLPPLLGKDQIVANEAFWSRVETQELAPIERAVTPPDPNEMADWKEKLLAKFRVRREPDQNAIIVGSFYSRSLNFWGVQLQRANELEKAAKCFDSAKRINPYNVVAGINLQFNQSLRERKDWPVDLSQATSDRFGQGQGWNEVLNENGPFDELNFCLEEGNKLMRNGYFRQAAAALARVRQLAPDNLSARLWLGQIYVLSHMPDLALEVLHDPLQQPARFSLVKTNETMLNIVAAAAYFQKNDTASGTQLVETEIALHPNSDEVLLTAVQMYLARALYTNALAVIDRKLQTTPDDPEWLLTRGYACTQLKDYDSAIAALTHVLRLQTNNSTARFNRAVACLNSDKLDEARADYEMLQQSFTNSFQIAYGLGEIAWRKHDTNQAIKNYTIYLANANTNTAEATNILQRLHELKGKPH